jgi:hypothetical protein
MGVDLCAIEDQEFTTDPLEIGRHRMSVSALRVGRICSHRFHRVPTNAHPHLAV